LAAVTVPVPLAQPDLFGAPPNPLHDLLVRLPTPCRCGSELALTGPRKGPHALSLRCADCGQHRSWLSRAHCMQLTEIINQPGRPFEPVLIRPPSMPQAASDLSTRRNRNGLKWRNEMVTRQEAFPSRWLSASDLPKPAVLEISETSQEMVRGNDGRSVK